MMPANKLFWRIHMAWRTPVGQRLEIREAERGTYH